MSVKGCRYWQRIRNCCSEVGVALGGHSDTGRNTRRVVSTYDVSHRQVALSGVPFGGSHSGVAEDQVFWDVMLCRCFRCFEYHSASIFRVRQSPEESS